MWAYSAWDSLCPADCNLFLFSEISSTTTKMASANTPPGISCRVETPLQKLLSQGVTLDEVRELVHAQGLIPASITPLISLRAGDLYLPLDVAVDCLTRELDQLCMPTSHHSPANDSREVTTASPGSHQSTSGPSPHSSASVSQGQALSPLRDLPSSEMSASTSSDEYEKRSSADNSSSSVGTASGPPLMDEPAGGSTGTVSGPPDSPIQQTVTMLPIITPPKRPRIEEPTVAGGLKCKICDHVTQHLRPHVELAHLPWFFHPTTSCFVCKTSFQRQRLLRAHATEHHPEDPTRCYLSGPDNYDVWLGSMLTMLRTLTSYAGFVAPIQLAVLCEQRMLYPSRGTHFQAPTKQLLEDLVLILDVLHPNIGKTQLNQTVNILQWEVLYHLISMLVPRHKLEDFRKLEPDDRQFQHLVGGLGQPSSVDSHCHLRTAAIRSKLSPSDFAQMLQQRSPSRLLFIIDNRVFDTADWHEPRPTSVQCGGAGITPTLRIHYTFGCHPRWASTREKTLRELDSLLQLPECVGVGEMGLDHTCPESTWAIQKESMRRQAMMGVAHQKTLVLHLRGKDDEDLPSVLQEALDCLARAKVPSKHPIHVHCFTGDLKLCKLWLRGFPRTVFGVSMKTLATEQCRSFVSGVCPLNFVLETDSPYLAASPWDVRQVAESMAVIRNLPARTVMKIATQNCCSIYGLDLHC